MSLKTKLANKPIVDQDGFAQAILDSITFIDASDTEFDREQFQFSFKVEGTRKETTINLWTGTTISGEKYDNGTSIYYTEHRLYQAIKNRPQIGTYQRERAN
ncbi:MAG: hypothetical protein ACFBSE_14505 [Prochloraceae cyanobacterium]